MIAIVVGTRPEIIKMAPVKRLLKKNGVPFVFLHTNQHYSKEMDADIIQDLKLDAPDFNFKIGSLPHAAQTGRAMEGLEKYFMENRPSFVLVHGDTNTTLAGAMAAKKLNIPIGHVEAGLRSFDEKMPEEINRILVDRISDIHFAPTETAKKNLLNDGFNGDTVVVCGNTVVDALNDHLELSKKSLIHKKFKLEKDGYILATAHRPENVDHKEGLSKIINLLAFAGEKLGKKVLLPLHPRTAKNLEKFNIPVPSNLIVVNPVGYIDMLALIDGSSLVMTDSGGIQEEAYVLKKPLLTMRDSTERPETLTANFLIEAEIDKFLFGWKSFNDDSVSWNNSFGLGDTSKLILSSVQKFLDER